MKYQNVTDHSLILTGFGLVPAGATIDIDGPLENPNFKPVSAETEPATAPVEAVAAPEIEQPNETQG